MDTTCSVGFILVTWYLWCLASSLTWSQIESNQRDEWETPHQFGSLRPTMLISSFHPYMVESLSCAKLNYKLHCGLLRTPMLRMLLWLRYTVKDNGTSAPLSEVLDFKCQREDCLRNTLLPPKDIIAFHNKTKNLEHKTDHLSNSGAIYASFSG